MRLWRQNDPLRARLIANRPQDAILLHIAASRNQAPPERRLQAELPAPRHWKIVAAREETDG
jgi:hypothetical protein